MKLSSVRIGTRLLIAFGAILALMTGVVITGTRTVSSIAADTRALSDTVFPKVTMPSDLQNFANDEAIAVLVAQISGTVESGKSLVAVSAVDTKAVDSVFAKIEPLVHNPPGSEYFARMKTARDRFRASRARLTTMLVAGADPRARQSVLTSE